ncbi:ranBP-type and C3HC4-type zinc finger-containing protein 1-like [Maniola hyperantus]|uniref:ranBP-type and C3HC4-type zinc finger-containing protein 1-like n=1 Tax=Aphantopus hyperantus TaxID=2795564 RepID=UPI0037489B97
MYDSDDNTSSDEVIVISDDSYHPTSSSESDNDDDINSDRMIIDLAMDTSDDLSESDANDDQVMDASVVDLSEYDANDKINCDRMTNDQMMDASDDPSSSSSEPDVIFVSSTPIRYNDSTPLVTLAGPDLNAPFNLRLGGNTHIASQTNNVTQAQIKTKPSELNSILSGDLYTELKKLEQQALVPNTEEFECGVCMEQCAVGAGAVLRECIHTFCRACLADVIRHCEEPVVACPAIQCPGALQEREIRAILSTEEYERWLARGLAAAENGNRNTFHCRTRDCKGWAFCEPEVRGFPCPVCGHINCVLCRAVHEGESCERYRAKLRDAAAVESTAALLKSLISRGEALECPECSAIITKKEGCDWIKCLGCKTEICWATKGRRWGPGGRGDTSGGCKCGVRGKRCHPSCGNCH